MVITSCNLSALAQDQIKPEVEALIGQLLLLSFSGQQTPLQTLSTIQPAGFLFYPGNISSTTQIRQLTLELQQHASYPLLLAIDQEGGPFSSYRVDDATLFPGQWILGRTQNLQYAYDVAYATGRELAFAGFNVNFSPVADVNSNPLNPIIGIRAFGESPELVAEFAAEYTQGLLDAGIAAVGKHFPGHGDTSVDSHLALPLIPKNFAALQEVELQPFQALINSGIPALMTAHVLLPEFNTSLPATLAPEISQELLREELGFEGLLISDYMDMRAIQDLMPIPEAAVHSVNAGVDLLLLGPDTAQQHAVHQALVQAYRDGRLSEKRILTAVSRSSHIAMEYPAARNDQSAPDYEQHYQLALDVALQGAHIVHNDGTLPLSPDARVLILAPGENNFGKIKPLWESMPGSEVDWLSLSNPPQAYEFQLAQEKAASADIIILVVDHWSGQLPINWFELVRALPSKTKVLVSLGKPELDSILGFTWNAYIEVYGFRPANVDAAARLLHGFD